MSDQDELRRVRADLAEAHETIRALVEGEVDAVVGEGQTVVLARQAQAALREREAQLRALFESAIDAILIADDEGRYVDANPAASELLGAPKEAILDRSIADFSEADFDLRAAWEHFLDKGSARGEHTVVRPDGERRFAEYVARAHILPGRHLSMMRDVTEHKRSAAAQADAERELHKLSLAVEQTSDSITITDSAGVIEYVNPAFEAITGFSAEEVIGRTPAVQRSGKHDRAFYEQMWAELTAGRSFQATFVNQKKDGTLYREEKTLSPIFGSDGTIERYCSVGRDVTTRDEMADQLRQAQKMEAVGQLAGGVAHDFNNLLTAIISFASFVEEELGSSDPNYEDIASILEAARRGETLTRQLLAFSRRQQVHPQVVSPVALLSSLHRMLHRLLGEQVTLVERFGSGGWHVRIDPGAFEQVIVNLALNARDAMPGGGELVIETSNLHLDTPWRTAGNEEVPAGEYALVSVQDAGEGMNEATRRRALEPFFTTKEQGKGTGLGLATCYGIVKQAGGFLWLSSEPEGGTTVRLFLPRCERVVRAETDRPASSTPSARGETVLVVEDEAAVRQIAARALERRGYHVLVAPTPRQAEDRMRELGSALDLLLTDVVMPEMSGPELAAELRKEQPGLRILFMSGYAAEALERHDLPPGTSLVKKPFSPDELAARVREELDRD